MAFVFLVVSFVSIFILPWSGIALIIAASNRYLNNKITLEECFLKAKGIYWRFIGVILMYSLFYWAGLLLFVIPGIYLGIIFLLAFVAVVLEKKDVDPFKISRALIKGSFWKVFLISLLLSIMLLFCLYLAVYLDKILAETFIIIFSPFSWVVTVLLYYRLKEKREAEQSLQNMEVPIKRGSIGCFSAIGLIILIIILSTCWKVVLRKYF
jgi:hypothetical protein